MIAIFSKSGFQIRKGNYGLSKIKLNALLELPAMSLTSLTLISADTVL